MRIVNSKSFIFVHEFVFSDTEINKIIRFEYEAFTVYKTHTI